MMEKKPKTKITIDKLKKKFDHKTFSVIEKQFYYNQDLEKKVMFWKRIAIMFMFFFAMVMLFSFYQENYNEKQKICGKTEAMI